MTVHIVELQIVNTNPRQIGGFHASHAFTGDRLQQVVIAAQGGPQLRNPIGSVVKRRFRGNVVQRPGAHDQVAAGSEKTCPQVGVWHHGGSTAQSWNVVGLGGRKQRYRAVRNFRYRMGDGQMLFVFIQNQLAVNLVADQQQIVAFQKFAQGLQFDQAVAPSGRILRIGDADHFDLLGGGVCHGGQIHGPQAIVQRQWRGNLPTTGIFLQIEKRVIDGGGHQNLFVAAEHVDRHVQARHHAGQPDDPVFGYLPTVVVRQPALKGVGQ